MRNEEDVMDYYREFLELANPLQVTQQLSDEDRNAKFFKGFHRDNREILSSHIFSMRPDHPQDRPYELDDVFKAARSYFSNVQFYRPVQQRIRNNDYDYDSNSDYEPQDSRHGQRNREDRSRHHDPCESLDNHNPRREDRWQRDRDRDLQERAPQHD